MWPRYRMQHLQKKHVDMQWFRIIFDKCIRRRLLSCANIRYICYVASYVRITTWHDHQSSASLETPGNMHVMSRLQSKHKKNKVIKENMFLLSKTSGTFYVFFNVPCEHIAGVCFSLGKNTGLPFQLDCWYPAELPNKLVTMPTDTGRFVNPQNGWFIRVLIEKGIS